jgi:hypothetical protein
MFEAHVVVHAEERHILDRLLAYVVLEDDVAYWIYHLHEVVVPRVVEDGEF